MTRFQPTSGCRTAQVALFVVSQQPKYYSPGRGRVQATAAPHHRRVRGYHQRRTHCAGGLEPVLLPLLLLVVVLIGVGSAKGCMCAAAAACNTMSQQRKGASVLVLSHTGECELAVPARVSKLLRGHMYRAYLIVLHHEALLRGQSTCAAVIPATPSPTCCHATHQ